MSAIICLLSLLLISVQGLEVRTPLKGELAEQHATVVKEIKGLLADHVEGVQKDINDKIQNLQVFLQTSAEEGKNRISKQYEKTRLSLRELNAPEVCLNEAELKLNAAEKKTTSNFFTCSNLTIVASDVVEIVFVTGQLGVDLLLTADTILNGLGDCMTWNPFKAIYCAVGWVKDVFSGTFGVFRELKNFTNNITEIVTDIKNQVNYCMHGSSDEVHLNTVKAFQHVHQCAQRNN